MLAILATHHLEDFMPCETHPNDTAQPIEQTTEFLTTVGLWAAMSQGRRFKFISYIDLLGKNRFLVAKKVRDHHPAESKMPHAVIEEFCASPKVADGFVRYTLIVWL
jgi:hypothetical protein